MWKVGITSNVFIQLMCLLLLSASAHGLDWVRVGSWNIENLGDREFGQSPKALAEHILFTGVDVLALQEIWDTDEQDSTRTNGRLDAVVAVMNENDGQNWEYVLFEKRSANDIQRLTGVMWNKARVSLVGEPFKVPVPYSFSGVSIWDRKPHAVKFSYNEPSKTDFVVTSLHMKSNRGRLSENKKKRTGEATTLAQQIDTISSHFGGETDIILIGDTNVKEASEDAVEVLVEAGFKDLNAADLSTFVGSRNAPFDRVFVPAEESEFRFSKQYLFRETDETSHENFLSDHYLIQTAIRVENDDD